jgi:hypothetical protein
MPRYPSRSMLPSLLAGAGLVMACIVYAEVRARPTIEDQSYSQARPVKVSSAGPALRQGMPIKDRFSVIVERPLFSPVRRPNTEELAAEPAPALDFTLSGIVISSGEPFALLKPSAGDGVMRVKEGDDVTGWTVARIEPDRIVVRQRSMEQELFLDFGAPAPARPETTMPKAVPADQQGNAQANQQGNAPGTGQADTDTPEPTPPPEADEPVPANQKSASQSQSQ